VTASAGVLRRWTGRLLLVEAGVDLLTGALFVAGDGYSTARSTRSWDLGAEAGGRLGLALGRIQPWLGLGLCRWLRPQLVEVAGIPGQGRLPPLEARLGIGADIVWDP
jgi:hypothetical protein